MANKSDDFINRREYECHIQRRSLEMWLGWLNPIRWLMVSVTTILSALAAATVLARTSLWASHYQTYAGLCALGSAILSGLHTNLRCDPHQSEGSRLISLYNGLEAGFQSARRFDDPEQSVMLSELDKNYQQLLSTSTASAPAYFVRRARKEREAEQ